MNICVCVCVCIYGVRDFRCAGANHLKIGAAKDRQVKFTLFILWLKYVILCVNIYIYIYMDACLLKCII